MKNKLTELLNDINNVLKQNNINVIIGDADLSICNNTICDSLTGARLSNAIINNIWPSIKQKEVYHYTSKEAAENILNTGTFRLYCISKRFHEHEIKTFCENHKLDGYLKKDKYGEVIYKDLIMPNTFYSSFTDIKVSKKQEKYFWNCFAGTNGVRFKFIINASDPDFRKIVYEKIKGKPIKVLNDLIITILNYNMQFYLSGISRLCSFYLSEKYDIENEYRMLYRYWKGPNNLTQKNDGKYNYVEIPINQKNASGFCLKIIEIQTNAKINITSNYSVIKRNCS